MEGFGNDVINVPAKIMRMGHFAGSQEGRNGLSQIQKNHIKTAILIPMYFFARTQQMFWREHSDGTM